LISFLIPVYNRDVRTLVNELWEQCRKADVEFEILVYDDFSTEKYKIKNRELSSKTGVAYLEMSKNYGRSGIRNWLAKNSRYKAIVFLDCDQYIRRRTFVQKYIMEVGGSIAVYGGTSYKKKAPAKSHVLHWKYGRNVEAKSPSKRKKTPFLSFRSNNFMIDRDLFLKYAFNESITSYGYEDTMLALRLEEEGIAIKHIDNPIEHAGLEKIDVFLQKTKTAISNLSFLEERGVKTRLTKFYEKLKDFALLGILRKFKSPIHQWIDKSLHSEDPSMRAFQLFKLFLYIDEKESDKNESQN